MTINDVAHLQSHKNWCCTSTITRQMIMYILWPHNNWCCTRTIPRQMMYMYNHITTDAVHQQSHNNWCCTSTSTRQMMLYIYKHRMTNSLQTVAVVWCVEQRQHFADSGSGSWMCRNCQQTAVTSYPTLSLTNNENQNK